ncbi:hypothetical protein NPIL_594021 [Nephila pilipes]|uniref:Uncharacterized protein n=1 Tax=Nephila pilipes TaxID=299642 RepID=A0A8X6NLK4_NEPPI|nr:hypothetical protein NPIL_594021 [Nephila pilipes]
MEHQPYFIYEEIDVIRKDTIIKNAYLILSFVQAEERVIDFNTSSVPMPCETTKQETSIMQSTSIPLDHHTRDVTIMHFDFWGRSS